MDVLVSPLAAKMQADHRAVALRDRFEGDRVLLADVVQPEVLAG